MFALQSASGDVGAIVVVALVVVGLITRRRRRAKMTPEERAIDDVKQEVRSLRREVRRNRS